jgi:hypothetical protein
MSIDNIIGDLFIPECNAGLERKTVIERITHLAIGAHQDDVEFMAFRGIIFEKYPIYNYYYFLCLIDLFIY